MALDESEGESSVMNPYQRTQQNKGYYGLLYHNLGYYVSAEDVYNSVGFTGALNSGYLTAGDISIRIRMATVRLLMRTNAVWENQASRVDNSASI